MFLGQRFGKRLKSRRFGSENSLNSLGTLSGSDLITMEHFLLRGTKAHHPFEGLYYSNAWPTKPADPLHFHL